MVNRDPIKKKDIVVLGAGLVGSLMAIYLSKRGYKVNVFEKRGDVRIHDGEEGRSINLALSCRGWKALEEVGLVEDVKKIAIEMKGRMMHGIDGKLSFQPYGKEGEVIHSVSRSHLNGLLISAAEKSGSVFFFNNICREVIPGANKILVNDSVTEKNETIQTDIIIGADGAFSALRNAMHQLENFTSSLHFFEYGYKELTIPPATGNKFALDHNSLHIWPRKQYMLIALPNPDKTFTCTLFYPSKGKNSFEYLDSRENLMSFFKKSFPDVIPLMPGLEENFFKNPTASLTMLKCYPWEFKGKSVLIGDAAHAILPFFGQGMNSGFEDCRILNELIGRHHENWEQIFGEFQQLRKPDTDAIAELALQNFVEMKDLVADAKFLIRKKIEARLHQLFPGQWIPLYSMVTFSHIPYSEAHEKGKIQERIMDEVMQMPDIENNWEQLDYSFIIEKYKQLSNT